MKTLEINTNNEWLQVFSTVDFGHIDESDCDMAAEWFTTCLWDELEAAGYHVEPAKGQRRTCHGWNGANTFRHLDGPVGSFDELAKDELEDISDRIARTETRMQAEFNSVSA